MRGFCLSAILALSLASSATAQEAEYAEEEFIPPAIHPSQEGSTGIYHVRSAYTLPHPGAAFEGNDHFYGSNNYYQPDNRSVRATETRDCLTVNIVEGIDFTAASIFRSAKVAADGNVGQPTGVLATPLPSIPMFLKLAWIAPDRSYAFAVEPFWELRAVPHDFAMDLKGSPIGARFMASRDFRYDRKWPFRVHANLGYRFDRSAGLLDRAKVPPHNFSPPNVPADPDLTTEELYALGVPRTPMEAAFGLFRDDQILVGVGAELLTTWITPFVEYSGEIVLGGLPFASSPKRLTLGGRITPRPDYGDLTVDLAVDLSLTRRGLLPSAADGTLTEVQVEPGVAYTVAVGWVFGYRKIPTPVKAAPASSPSSNPTTAPVSQPANEPLSPPLPDGNGMEARVGALSLLLPEGSAVSCTGDAITLCSVRAPGAKVPLFLRAASEGAKSPFAHALPQGVPGANEGAQTSIAGQPALEWRGEGPEGASRVIRFMVAGVEYEISYEGASPEDARRYDEALHTARLQ